MLDQSKAQQRKWWALALLATAQFVVVLDASIVNVALPTIRRDLHAHPEPSVSALARALGRQYRRVHEDVTVLEGAGLLDRNKGSVRTTADAIQAEIRF